MTTSANPSTPDPLTDDPRVQTKVIENGPLQVKGPVELLDHDGNPYDLKGRKTIFLCRCGRSTNKPFCDGTHARTGFAAAERAVAEKDSSSPPGHRPVPSQSRQKRGL